MTVLELLLAAAGIGVTSMVIAAMVLITPAGSEDLPGDTDSMGSNLSAAPSDAARERGDRVRVP